jgi:hypothetical protein
MYLLNLEIKNLKLIRELSWSFERAGKPRMWTVFIGKNGLCKTSILRAVAMAATGYVRANQLGEEILSSLPDRRRSDATVEIDARFTFSKDYHESRIYPGLDPRPAEPPVLDSTLRLEPGKRLVSGKSRYSSLSPTPVAPGGTILGAITLGAMTLGSDPVADARTSDLRHWFIAGYGVTRSLPQPGANERHGDPLMSRLNPLFDKGRLVGTGFTDDLEHRAEYVKTLQEILSGEHGLLPHVTDVELRGRGGVRSSEDFIERHRIVFDVGGHEMKIPAVWMSHGYQATMAWVADLVGQIFLEAKSAVPADKMEGIVLIDEIDLHLHPAWQVELIPALKRVFPRLQFIVTTHSPMVLPGLDEDEIVILQEDGEGNVEAIPAPESPALMTGSDIYRTFFGIDRLYPVDLGEALRRYGFLVGNPLRTDDEEHEMHEIQKRLGDHGLDPGWKPVDRRERPRFPGREGNPA